MRRGLFASILLVHVPACAGGGAGGSVSAPAEPAVQIQAAALAHAFRHNDSTLRGVAEFLCVRTGERVYPDPPLELMRILHSTDPRATADQDCWRGPVSGRGNLRFYVSEPAIEGDRAQVMVGYVEDGPEVEGPASRAAYRQHFDCALARDPAGWIVESCDEQ